MTTRERGARPDAPPHTGRRHVTDSPDSTGRVSPLRVTLADAAAELGCSLADLTVLDKANDPFRLDTPARHRDGGVACHHLGRSRFATTLADLGVMERVVHLRGVHYMVIGRPKPDPDGTPYANTEKDWLWLSEDAAFAARWLGYIPFEQIVDHRNTEPVARKFNRPDPWPYIAVGVHVNIPDVHDLAPTVDVDDFTGVQPYRLVIFGEKSSLEDVLAPIAEQHAADLYLMTGEISTTYVHKMAKDAAEDGRPTRVLTFSDCDPAGWQMPISIARKLQAFAVTLYPGLDYQVHRVALTPDHVRSHGLPSTPLKDTERRADKWRTAMGTEQTEIDALAALRPELLAEITRDALAPFFDHTLQTRVRQAERAWITEAQAIVDAGTNEALLAQIRTQAHRKLTELRAEIDALNEALRVDADEFELPPIVVPQPHLNGGGLPPLACSSWSFAEQTRRLIASKQYRAG